MSGRSLSRALLAASALVAAAAENPRVFVTESMPLQVSGKDDRGSISISGGTSPQSIEVMKQLRQRCPQVIVTADRARADYTVRLDHEPANPTTFFVHGNKLAVFDKNQDLVFSDSTRLLRTAVEKACVAIVGHATDQDRR